MKRLLMLEDDPDRIQRFLAIVVKNYPHAELSIHRTAPAFIAAYETLTATPDLICLDHDLFPDSVDDPDPGDGRDVAAFLASQPALAPVLIHSTNARAAESMLFSLRDAGWNVDRIAPLGEDWIEAYWFGVASEMIAGKRPEDESFREE
ncbi:cyclic-phosphate processing receiver domain-containing protein [Blastopirellula retiformator]|uniref:Cyclic-phosphate processing Receiver domain-containing protein n=1 Tax=Blastopirellula retiformator TaxID=2527970 RepID=A0A5C5VLY1_9BACT|nr:cyclic-phosphate processing receiver domain-containing protein [Blastopirellula retiformator]TWT38875.1 hypothetical protein Enr8_05690 [Blastopirellula retiformator]